MIVEAITPELGIRSSLRDSVPARLELTGELVIQTAGDARDALGHLMSQRPEAVDIDLSELERLDAAGLAAVTSAAMWGRRNGVFVTVVPPRSPHARHIADRVGILHLLGSRRP